MSCHTLLGCKVSAESSAVNLMGIPLYVICCFSFAAFSIFSLYLIFDCLIMNALRIEPHPTHQSLSEALVQAGHIGAKETERKELRQERARERSREMYQEGDRRRELQRVRLRLVETVR